MYKLRDLLLYLTHLYVSFSFRSKRVFVVTGLRRSGNHAFINWLTNALEESDIPLKKLISRVSVSASEKTLFYNEVNQSGAFSFINLIRQTKTDIKKASTIIISLEDYTPILSDPFFPKKSQKITIKRQVLNTVASRLKHAINQAKIGLDQGNMAIDENFRTFVKWQQSSECQNQRWKIWNFDRWLNEPEYREDFLSDINLSFDKMPHISKEGGGSSFSGESKLPTKEELSNRWQQVEWPERIIQLLNESEINTTLSEEERAFLREVKSK